MKRRNSKTFVYLLSGIMRTIGTSLVSAMLLESTIFQNNFSMHCIYIMSETVMLSPVRHAADYRCQRYSSRIAWVALLSRRYTPSIFQSNCSGYYPGVQHLGVFKVPGEYQSDCFSRDPPSWRRICGAVEQDAHSRLCPKSIRPRTRRQ